MGKAKKISVNLNYTAVNIGEFARLSEHSLVHPVSKQVVDGKVFLKEITGSTGTEISFNVLPAENELSYFHIHEQNEETYIILSGSGDFQVDGDCFPVSEGSVVRIAPGGARGMRNSSAEDMIYMVVQSKENSLEQYSTADGRRVEAEKIWQSK